MDASLVADLNAAAEQEVKTGRAKRMQNEIWDNPDLILNSWKFNEWDYYNSKLKLPIRARGLFTKGNKIIVRGYDKFFNINETSETKWENILTNTTGPYYVTLKENGCKIMIAGCEGKLVVTSKNSTGPRPTGGEKNHSLEALRWIRKRLKEVGKTEEELANELEVQNLTGVGEFCDDSFEEHVLAYPPESAGLYFNGLNVNSRKFQTLPPQKVNEFGAKYGFLKTDFLTIDDVDELKKFLEQCAESGAYEGRDIEGFVVRCKRGGDDFFFKYKFEEPYLMYRTWREATKQILRDPQAAPKPGKHRESTQEYVKFLRPFMAKNPQYKTKVLNEGKGIIELREKFLEQSQLDPEELLKLQLDKPLTPKYALISVATLGCGKTTVAVTLSKLLGWGHVQNDDVGGKNGSSKFKGFMNKVADAFTQTDVVLIDRNNHQYRERQMLFESLDQLAEINSYQMHYVCLDFLPDGPTPKTWNVTRKRVQDRGENHQTIRNMDDKMVENIMKGFCGRFQPVVTATYPDSRFEHHLNVDCKLGSRHNAESVIRSMAALYKLDLPYTTSQLDSAFSRALAYKATIPGSLAQPKKKYPGWSFFCILLDSDPIKKLCDRLLQDVPLWSQLQAEVNGASIKPEFHVTLAHKSGSPAHFKHLKGQYQAALAKSTKTGFVEIGPDEKVVVRKLCWNSKILAATVDLHGEHVSANFIPHITIGMLKGVQAKEANDMLAQEDGSVDVEGIEIMGRVCAFR